MTNIGCYIKIKTLHKYRNYHWRLFALTILVVILSSCGNSKLLTENRQLKSRIIDLEQRIYELTDSPEHLSDELLHDVNLLMTVPSRENLELALDLINGFKQTYKEEKYYKKLDKKAKEIQEFLSPSNQDSFNGNRRQTNYQQDIASDVHLQFSVEISKRSLGFVNVKIIVQNMSKSNVSNLWLRVSLIGVNGETYGITQDFFFNRLAPYEEQDETLTWEYVKIEQIGGVRVSQMRFSQNRQNRLLREGECSIGKGNVKIFLDF